MDITDMCDALQCCVEGDDGEQDNTHVFLAVAALIVSELLPFFNIPQNGTEPA